MKKAGTCPDSSGFIVHGYIWMHNFHDDESTSRRTSLGRGNDHRFPPQPYDQGSRLDKLECDIPWSSQLLPGLKVPRIHPGHHIYIFLHPSDVPACSISVILATTGTQSCLLACSCPNACHAKKNDSGVLVLVCADWKYHCGQTRQQNILYIPRSSKRWWMDDGCHTTPLGFKQHPLENAVYQSWNNILMTWNMTKSAGGIVNFFFNFHVFTKYAG